MRAMNMLEAKTNPSRLVEALESGAETGIIIARNGKPGARLVPFRAKPLGVRIGVAKRKLRTPVDVDKGDDPQLSDSGDHRRARDRC